MAGAFEAQTRASLLSAIRDPRDERAWTDFTAQYEALIRAGCRAKGLQAGDVDDLTQAILLRLFETMPSFVYDPEQGFRRWLRTVVANAARDFWRARRRRPGDWGRGDAVAVGILADLPDDGEHDFESVSMALADQMEQDRRLRRACERVRARVEEKTWRAFWLMSVEGLSGKEVAERLGMGVAAAYVAKSRVRQMIRQEVGESE